MLKLIFLQTPKSTQKWKLNAYSVCAVANKLKKKKCKFLQKDLSYKLKLTCFLLLHASPDVIVAVTFNSAKIKRYETRRKL